MQSRRQLAKKILLLLRNIKGDELLVKDIEFVFRDGMASSLKLEIQGAERPKLKILKGDKKD